MMPIKPEKEKIQVLSLGAGVQSSVLLLMSCCGELPKLDLAIFADTGWEPQSVYTHLKWLKEQAAIAKIPLVTVQSGNLRNESLKFHTASSDWKGRQTEGRAASMPLFVRNADGSRGKIRRQCTMEYKIVPIERYLRREILGLTKGQHAPRSTVIDQWRGITVDEIYRLKESRHKWMRVVYPFVGMPVGTARTATAFDRANCLHWFDQHYPGRELPRSACIGCPFHRAEEWRRLRDTDPVAWADAIDFDRRLRSEAAGAVHGEMYLHDSLTPLEHAPIDRSNASIPTLWGEECEGMCGL